MCEQRVAVNSLKLYVFLKKIFNTERRDTKEKNTIWKNDQQYAEKDKIKMDKNQKGKGYCKNTN